MRLVVWSIALAGSAIIGMATATELTNRPMEAPRPVSGEYRKIVPPVREAREIAVLSTRVDKMPVVDGNGDEDLWRQATEVQTLDHATQRKITIKSVHTDSRIAFLVTYPHFAPMATHKSWAWDKKEEVYKPWGDREDQFIFKFSLTGNSVSLALRDGEPHRADIWFWKACRTDTMGFADDKWQAITKDPAKDAVELNGKHGKVYLKRSGDAGRAAYEDVLPGEYQGEVLPGFRSQMPEGSRADIRAKGVWKDGRWTVEFQRALRTGNDDDVQFELGGKYLFGVSCYEMAGTGIEPTVFQPLYRCGDVFDRVMLEISKP